MSQENVEVVRQMYDAYARGDFATGLSVSTLRSSSPNQLRSLVAGPTTATTASSKRFEVGPGPGTTTASRWRS